MNQEKTTSTVASSSELPEEEDWDAEPLLPAPAPEWKHFVTQLNQVPGDGSTTDWGLGTVAMEEEGTQVNTTGDKEVKGRAGEMAVNVALNVTDDLTWHTNDPYLEIDDESSGMHQTPVAALTPLSIPMEDAVLLSLEPLIIKKPCREIPVLEPELVDDLILDYLDAPLMGFTRPDLTRVLAWIRFKAKSMCKPPWRTELSQIQKDDQV